MKDKIGGLDKLSKKRSTKAREGGVGVVTCERLRDKKKRKKRRRKEEEEVVC